MNKKSLGINSIIYSIKTIIGLVVPLITYPYITRILEIETIGKVNFSSSIISYFSLIAGLGIYTFAVREGAKIRNNQEEINLFASEVFTLNILTTIIAYILFIIMLIVNDKWHDYIKILLIISVSIPLTTLGVDWIFTIYEEYAYITIRTVFVQILSVIFLFIFVKTDSDIYWYAIYTVFVGTGSNIFNFIRSKKYLKLHICINKNMLQYFKPILFLFASSIATQIYLNSDITILGYIASDKEVGLYNCAVKVYNILKTVLLSLSTVSVPRLAYLIGNSAQEEYDNTFTHIFNLIFYLAIPCSFGLAVVSNDVIVIFAGSKYYISGTYLKILCFSCPFSVLGSFLASGCLVLFDKENRIFISSIIGAILNIGLNIFLIPRFGSIIASITTLISEIVTVIIHLINIKTIYKIRGVFISSCKSLISGVLMMITCIFIHNILNFLIFKCFLTILTGMIVYFICSIALKNQIAEQYSKTILLKLLHR